MKLVIISHTEHYRRPDGIIVGWGPTVSEINNLLELFDAIDHVAMLKDSPPPSSAITYASDKVTFIPIPAVGGPSLGDKLKIMFHAPQIVRTVSRVLRDADYFQFRAPTGIGAFLIPYLNWFVKTPGWFKYAGNWNQDDPPLGYAIQRALLKRQKRQVTINGSWPDQPEHCLTFENPCLTDEDLETGKKLTESRRFEQTVSFCFVGRLEQEKGVERIIEAVKLLPDGYRNRIGTIHFVGESPQLTHFKSLADHIEVSMTFHGSLNRRDVFQIYAQTQFFLLPTTASEGFPKVLAEALNFGCIPIVSDISSISQYIHDGHNGKLLQDISANGLRAALEWVFELNEQEYRTILQGSRDIVPKFGYAYYNNRIKTELIKEAPE